MPGEANQSDLPVGQPPKANSLEQKLLKEYKLLTPEQKAKLKRFLRDRLDPLTSDKLEPAGETQGKKPAVSVNASPEPQDKKEESPEFRQFKELTKNIKRATIGKTLILPLSVSSTISPDTSPKFLIGADPEFGIIRIYPGNNNAAIEIIGKRRDMPLTERQEIEEAIATYNKGKPAERQMREGLRKIPDTLTSPEKQVELVLWDGTRFLTFDVKKLKPEEKIVSAAISKNSVKSTLYAVATGVGRKGSLVAPR